MSDSEHILNDGEFTLVRNYEANPATFRLTFTHPLNLAGLRLTTRSMDYHLQLEAFQSSAHPGFSLNQEFRGLANDPTVEISFGRKHNDIVHKLFGIESLSPGNPFKSHVRELALD